MIGGLLGFGLPRWAANVLSYIGLPLLIAGLLYLAVTAYGGARYDAGVADERAAQLERERRAELAQREQERRATAALERSRRADDQAAATRKTEIDDATRNLPDQAPSARQRTRACIELRRQVEAGGGNYATC